MTVGRSADHLIEHMNHFLLVEQALAHQALRQQREKLGAAMTFQVLEFGQCVVDLAGGAQTDDAVRVLRWHVVVLVVMNLFSTDSTELAELT